MSTLAIFLLLVLVLSVFCLLLGGSAANLAAIGSPKPFKTIILIFVWLLAVVLCAMVGTFIGWSEYGSPQVPTAQQRRIAHTGYYFARDEELMLYGKPAARESTEEDGAQDDEDKAPAPELKIIQQLMPSGGNQAAGRGQQADSAATDRGFAHAALAQGERLVMKPIWNGEKATRWKITYKVSNSPLRFETVENDQLVSQCVNLADERWLNSDDTLLLTLTKGSETRFVAIRWNVGSKFWWRFKTPTNAYYYGQGTIRNHQLIYDKGPDLLLSDVMLKEGFGLADLIKRAKPDFRRQVGTIDEEWWQVFDDITLVRERRGDKSSRLGILIADELFQRPGLKIYKNYSGEASRSFSPQDKETSAEISSDTTIIYGLGYKNSLELKLSDEVLDDAIWGQIVTINLRQPQSWPLPPSPTRDFIITTSNDYIPLDGYFIDIGNSPHSFYAKAKLSEDLDTLYINDGKYIGSDETIPAGKSEAQSEPPARSFSADQPVTLGDFQQGILLSLVPPRAAVSYTGGIATGLLILNALAFSFITYKQKKDRHKLYLAWTIMWGLLLTILTVRLVLAYRVSILPPFDASPEEIRNVFNKGVVVSLRGLAWCAALVFITPMVAALWTRFNESSWVKDFRESEGVTLILILLWGCAIAFWILAGNSFGTNQAFFGVRINMMVHLLVILGLALFAKKAMDDRWPSKLLICVVVIGIALGLQISVIGDAGVVIYAISLTFGIWLLLFWDSMSVWSRNWWQRVAALAFPLVPLFIILTVLFLPILLLPYLTQSQWIRSTIRPALPTTTFYRFASFTNSEEALLTSRSGDDEANMSILLDNSRQDWQMLLYASHGASQYLGYGQAPLSKRGMTYPTSMADCVFSIYLLSEHGKAAAFFLLLIYLMLGCVCIFAGWYLPVDVRHRNLTLVAIGAFFVSNSLYMAGANVGLTVFTGQNIPLLGLYSGSDLAQNLILVGLAGVLLLATETDSLPDSMRINQPVAYWMGVALCAGLAFWTVMIGWQLIKVGNEQRYRDDHNFSKDTFARIKNNLPPTDDSPSKRQNTPWMLRGERLDKKPGARVEEIEEQYAKQLNERTNKFDPNGGLYYLERARNSAAEMALRVRVNDRYFLVRSPFNSFIIWQGRIVASGESDPTICALGASLTVSLEETGYPGSIDLTKSLPVRATSSVLFTEGGTQFCELKRNGDQLRLDPKGRLNQWSLFVDGKKVTSAIDLQPLSIIVIERKDSKFRRNLIYLGPTPPILAFVRWRNGAQHRMFTDNSFPLAYLLGKAGDVSAQMEESLPAANRKIGEQLDLNIDIDLQEKLQQAIASYARSNRNYSPYRLQPNRLAVSVLNAFDGKLLASPSWPSLDPGNPEYENLISRLPEAIRSRFEHNHNLDNHIAGSTVKPIVFATMAAALLPAKFDLARMVVFNRADAYNSQSVQEQPTHPHLNLGKIRIGMWDCNSTEASDTMSEFLIHSRDFPEGVIGMLGMMMDEKEINKVLVPSSAPNDIAYEGRNYILDLTKVSENATAFSLKDQFEGRTPTMRGPEAVNNTILLRGLSSVFDFNYSDPGESWLRRASGSFLPMFSNQNLSPEGNFYLDNIVPAQIDLAGGDFQDIRGGLISCLLGGGDCGFNNVKMAEAAARLATGRRVFARLENYTAEPFPMMIDPIRNTEWRNSHIITPLQKAGEEGTAKQLRGSVKLPAQYKAIYKTGTILEGFNNRESEALMFVIGRWENSGFVEGETLAGFIYMERSKSKDPNSPDGQMKKFSFAAPILNQLIKYLVERREAGR